MFVQLVPLYLLKHLWILELFLLFQRWEDSILEEERIWFLLHERNAEININIYLNFNKERVRRMSAFNTNQKNSLIKIWWQEEMKSQMNENLPKPNQIPILLLGYFSKEYFKEEETQAVHTTTCYAINSEEAILYRNDEAKKSYYRWMCYSKWSYSTLKSLSITTWCITDGVNPSRHPSYFNLCSKRSRKLWVWNQTRNWGQCNSSKVYVLWSPSPMKISN